jgi:CRP-like cAMP-binding protein
LGHDAEEVLARSLLGVLPVAARRAILGAAISMELPAHAPVLVEGEPSTCVFLLCAGAIRVFHGSQSGLEVALMFCRAPALFGEIEALLQMAHIENVATLEPSALLRIPNEMFLSCLDEHPAFARRMLIDVTAKLAMASHNQKALAFQNIQTRLATLFVDHAAFRGK